MLIISEVVAQSALMTINVKLVKFEGLYRTPLIKPVNLIVYTPKSDLLFVYQFATFSYGL